MVSGELLFSGDILTRICGKQISQNVAGLAGYGQWYYDPKIGHHLCLGMVALALVDVHMPAKSPAEVKVMCFSITAQHQTPHAKYKACCHSCGTDHHHHLLTCGCFTLFYYKQGTTHTYAAEFIDVLSMEGGQHTLMRDSSPS